jgi:carboxyl-terminal processing protease
MRAECSEQGLVSATVRKMTWVLALLGLLACTSTWTGSVGAVLGKDNHTGRVFVREAPPEMGAAKAGVLVGDEVTAIDGVPVSKMTADEVHNALSGKVGTKVKVTVIRTGVTVDCLVERGPLKGT